MTTPPPVDQIQPQWDHPTNIIIAGPTKSGKTVFARKLIRHRQWFFHPGIKKVVYLYGVWQDAYDEMKQEFGKAVTWVEGLPTDPYALFEGQTPGLLIVDDLMGEISSKHHRQVADWFTKGTHHMGVSLAVLLQNVYPKNMRESSLNAHFIVLFNNPRDQSQVQHLTAQAFPGQAAWIKAALKYAYQIPYRPLIMNFNPKMKNKYRLLVDPFPEDLKISKQPFPQALVPI